MEEQKIINKVTRVGVLGNVALAAFKLLAGIIGHSSAMVSDAAHSLSDIVATAIAYIGVRLSKQEKDDEHPYGHERMECVASLILSLILAGAGAAIGIAGIRKMFFSEAELQAPTMLPLIAAVISILVKEGMYRYTMHYARKIDSSAFKADAWHHRSDALSSVGALAGIGLARLGFPMMDPIASLLICAVIIKVAADIFIDSISKMLDTSAGTDFDQSILQFVEEQPDVRHVDVLQSRQFGNKVYVDLEITVQRDISLVAAHDIAESVHREVEERFPNIKHVMIHVNPEGHDD